MTIARVSRVLEAAFALTIARLVLGCVPFPRVAAMVGGWRHDAGVVRMEMATEGAARDVGLAIASAAGRLPWTSNCLVRAIAGHLLLRRRGIASAVVFGVRTDLARFDAHAWLLADGRCVTGGPDVSGYTPVGRLAPQER